MRQVGASALIKGGIYDDRSKFSLEGGYQTPLTEGLPTFMPGGTEAVSVGLGKSWKNKKGEGPSIMLQYERDLDYDDDRVGVQAGWVF